MSGCFASLDSVGLAECRGHGRIKIHEGIPRVIPRID
jgi:hypothetical protein